MNHEISQLQERARAALADGSEQAVLNEIAQWQSATQPVPEILHWQGLLLRALDQRSQAADVLRKAAAAAPQDAAIAHSLAQVLLEAGLPSAACFEAALILNPASSDIRLGLVSARFSDGHGEQALEELGAALGNNPGWIEGHRQYAQLCALMGRPEQAFATLDRTILAFPQSLDPWLAAISLAMSGFDYAAALDYAARAAAHHADDQQIAELRAGALDESDRLAEAASLFDKLGPASEQAGAVRRIRHHLRLRNPSAALKAAEPWLAGEHATQVWPYVALAWRLLGDRHSEWLEGQAGLVSQVDLDPEAIGLTALAQRLRSIHAKSGRFLDQSVRHGTQTNGPLFARVETEITLARAVLAKAVAQHLAGLPAHDPHHPQLALPRNQSPRFAGSWSVRLRETGFHASHHHPHGWFSSAFYVAVPETLSGPEGQLELGGAPPELGLQLEPLWRIEPKPGRLAIFPSTMWHGTLPFSKGERMSIAFDVAHPIEEFAS